MQHYRRKRTLAALNEMYLNNINRTKSYRDFLVLERGLISVAAEIARREEAPVYDHSVQLDLFSAPSITQINFDV